MLNLLQPLIQRLPAVSPVGRSLRRHLLTWLLLPQLVLWLAAAAVTYNVAVRYADRANDHGLYLSSRALARQVKPIDSGLFVDFPRAAKDIIEADPDDRVYYMVSSPPGEFILGNHKLPPPSAADALYPDRPTFYDGQVDTPGGGSVQVRVAAILLDYGEPSLQRRMLVQVAKSRVSREALARSILIDTVLPLSVLVLAMSALVWAGVRTGLAPLARLREAVSGRGPNDLAPIELQSAPEEVRDLAVAVNTLLAAVHASVVEQRRFISDAAHQLRTPLAGLKSQSELALKEATDPALRARLERVRESAARSAHLVTQLLTLARAEPESLATLGRSRFDLRRLVQDLAAEMVPRALGEGIDLGLDGGDAPDDAPRPPPLTIEGNALLIREAIVNLIDNAIRYAGRGTEITVRVRPDPDQPDMALVEVDDTGPGLPVALHEQVFDRFFRGTNEGRGCGLGLAIVKEIVERHRGRVRLQSLQPHGLRVQVRLPQEVRGFT
ncbi:sensor histidine kinase [Sphaerotilus sp.]|jgi:two-component system, OmpR family, sensor histidine kinase TctE|uniref:sensor histidine kinase n=1 Tax=Sphaerotilus sp. TaxID=2093942 RepID=UPI0025E5DBB4|nr:sensor histidine kinase [Sphaerotilus sp.]